MMRRRPAFLHLQRIRPRALAVTALLAAGLLVVGISQHFPLWLVVALTLLPWLPLVVFEAIWKYKHYGPLAIFAATTTLQIGFLITGGAQILSSYAAGAHDLRPAPEPALLFQAVGPFVGSTIALVEFRRNRWLWIVWSIASLRLADELYVIGTFVLDHGFYQAAGASGFFAAGGLLGLPLPRAYVVFLFTYTQVVLMLIGIAAQAAHAYDQYLAKAVPGLTEAQLVATSGQLVRLTLAAGAVIIRQGDPADRFYILARGEVEVIREEASGEHRVATLQAGQFFGEIGLLSNDARRTATIRALTAAEVLALDRDAFVETLGSSDQPKHYMEAVVAKRLAELRR